jgi:hypothetical protein
MYKTISNEIIRKFQPCYDPSKYIKDENEELTVKEWVKKYMNVVTAEDILWLLLRKEFMSEKDLILFAVWCAREALKLIANPDERSVNACNVAERYANGEATKDELDAAYIAAYDAAEAAYGVARAAYYSDAANYVVYYATVSVSYAARAAANSALSAVNADLAVANVSLAVSNAARVVYFTTLATSDTVSRADADAAYDAIRAVQIDQLLTYFNTYI